MSKIPFSIEYRPLIESGEYKVEIGREDPWPARIVCWDLNGDNIIAVVMNPEGREEGLIYTKQGKHNAICPRIDSDLFIIIPEPELTESEDERIRKALLEMVSDIAGGWPFEKHRITKKEAIKWLEKQKEQKPNHNTLPIEQQMEVAMIAIRGEMPSKSQEWNEQDKDMLNSCISSIEEAKENRYAYKENDGDTSYDREINWLKSLRPHLSDEEIRKIRKEEA